MLLEQVLLLLVAEAFLREGVEDLEVVVVRPGLAWAAAEVVVVEAA